MNTALIIPAYKPGIELLHLFERFQGNSDFLPIVVDDGSGPDYRQVFNALPGTVVLLRHEVNRGKGAALKTAIAYVLEHCPDCAFALTADADGQHRYEDILRINESIQQHPDALVLGSRKFDGKVPLRSRFGNGLTRKVFAIASGRKVYDTQTGLRAFGREAMQQFVAIPGNRYEYETNMLLSAAQSNMPIVEETIQTVYLEDNASSHFNPFRDSLKIYLCIFKFCASSILAFFIDFAMLMLLNHLTRELPEKTALAISVAGARLVSASVNFYINRTMVFKGDEKLSRAVLKYAALALAILGANFGLMYIFKILSGWALVPAKLIVEIILFCFSFVIQGSFVYRK